MMNLLCKIYRKLVETHWSYRKKHSQVRIQTGNFPGRKKCKDSKEYHLCRQYF